MNSLANNDALQRAWQNFNRNERRRGRAQNEQAKTQEAAPAEPAQPAATSVSERAFVPGKNGVRIKRKESGRD